MHTNEEQNSQLCWYAFIRDLRGLPNRHGRGARMNRYLEAAFELAERGVGRVSPNPAVGATIVRDGAVIGSGFYTGAGVKHAEILAIEDAQRRAPGLINGSTMYVTLEPHSHYGRTPPCVDAILAAGISKVVSAMEDPNPLVRGRGFARLKDSGVDVEIDSEYEARAMKLNEAFVHFMRTGLPLVTLKAAVTLDGKIAAPEDSAAPGWITSEIARAHVQTLRHRSDAILTGIGTVLADDCRLTDRIGEERSRPLLRIVLDSQLRLPPESQMVSACEKTGANDVLAVTTSAASA